MKITLINTFYPPTSVGGAEESVYELAESLVANGHEVVVATTALAGTNTPELSDNVRVYRWYSKVPAPYFSNARRRSIEKLLWHVRDIFDVRAFLFILRVLKREQPDVVHTHTFSGFGLAAWIAAYGRYPIAHTLRDFYLSCVSGKAYKEGANCERQCSSCALLRAPFKAARNLPDSFASVSDDCSRRHADLGYFKNDADVTTVYNDPDLSSLTKLARPNSEHFTFGFIGRLNDYKGIWIAIEAFQRLTGDDFRLVIAGDGDAETRSRLDIELETDPRISYLGRVRKEEFFAAVDVVLAPSQWHEPFGRIAAEAVAAQRWVVVPRLGGLSEIVSEYSLGRVIENSANVGRWTSVMREISELDRNERTVAERPDLQQGTVAEIYEGIYSEARRKFSERHKIKKTITYRLIKRS